MPLYRFLPQVRPMTQIINIINQATTPLGQDLVAIVQAQQWYIDKCLAPIWNVSATLQIALNVDPLAINILLLDKSDVEGALGYHDLESGLPVGRVFIQTALENGEIPSVTLAHELAELLVDPFCESLVINSDTGTVYPYEICDAVEENTFAAPNGVLLSNFVYPEWFQAWKTAPNTQYDYLKVLTTPFQLAAGGYITAIREGAVQTLWGSMEKKARWQLEDRSGHRLERLFTTNIMDSGLLCVPNRG